MSGHWRCAAEILLRSLRFSRLAELIREARAQVIGPIRQEILSGIRHPEQFQKLCEKMQAFPNLDLESSDYERAAEIFNRCRSAGVQGSNTDFLICAVSERLNLPILTTDQDFGHFSKFSTIVLHVSRPQTLN